MPCGMFLWILHRLDFLHSLQFFYLLIAWEIERSAWSISRSSFIEMIPLARLLLCLLALFLFFKSSETLIDDSKYMKYLRVISNAILWGVLEFYLQLLEQQFSQWGQSTTDVIDWAGQVAEPFGRAVGWLLNRRNGELDWGKLSNTPALLALSRTSVNTSLPEFQLAIKQLDINFLQDRLRYGANCITRWWWYHVLFNTSN